MTRLLDTGYLETDDPVVANRLRYRDRRRLHGPHRGREQASEKEGLFEFAAIIRESAALTEEKDVESSDS